MADSGSKGKTPAREDHDHRYEIVRIFTGERTAEQVVADLIKIHNGSGAA